MMQWSMRISAYSERLLQGLKTLDWPQPLKDSQEYWIGKSQGAQVKFNVEGHDEIVEVLQQDLIRSLEQLLWYWLLKIL
jgi:leucyl-tRNA synthetase